MSFKDYFSEQAAAYASYRPHYPPELFAWLASITSRRQRAWDCATGSGQAALALASHFAQVIASDASQAQLHHAQPHTRIHYVCASAEQIPLVDTSVDLITVAQAAHWFTWPRFLQEVARVLHPGGVLAIWCYGLFQISPAIDELLRDYYQHTLGAYWPAERRHIENAYADLSLPYPPLAPPAFMMQTDWNLSQVMGYLASWSATRLYLNATRTDPLPALQARLAKHWGAPALARRVQWPLHLKVGQKA